MLVAGVSDLLKSTGAPGPGVSNSSSAGGEHGGASTRKAVTTVLVGLAGGRGDQST